MVRKKPLSFEGYFHMMQKTKMTTVSILFGMIISLLLIGVSDCFVPEYNSLKSVFLKREVPSVSKIKVQNRVSSTRIGLFKNSKVSPTDTVSKYFDYWNQREMEKAIELFDEDCVYEDTLYPKVFQGKDALKSHLLNVASALPDSFSFVIDSVAEDKKNGNVGIQWHVESNGNDLPFTRGSSMYTVNGKGFIVKGFDVPEPTIKSGSTSLAVLKTAKNFITDPVRVLPLFAWIFYIWFVFLSNVAPGPNALQLDPATWSEVTDLSLNFWLIVPLLNPVDAPVRHPILEGVFNLVLVWGGLFAGFVIDGRSKKLEQSNSMIKYLLGMQFLTNAIYMPYLVNRDPEKEKDPLQVYKRPLNAVEKFGESKTLPLLFGGVALTSFIWGALGRSDFGDLSTRLASFTQLVSEDRLTFSFLIDFLYFAAFQGWLIDDDLQRRKPIDTSRAKTLKLIGTYVPLFGLVLYFLMRPELKNEASLEDQLK